MAVAEEEERRARAAAPRAERRVMVFMVVLVVVVVGLAVQGKGGWGQNETRRIHRHSKEKGRCQGSTECTKAHPPHPPTRPAHTLEACPSPYHHHVHEDKVHSLQVTRIRRVSSKECSVEEGRAIASKKTHGGKTENMDVCGSP